jgi:hypothetical protein
MAPGSFFVTLEYETYLADLTAQLNGLLPGAYTPDLMLIDELAKSIETGP